MHSIHIVVITNQPVAMASPAAAKLPWPQQQERMQ
jgi:hypothetical protein